MGRERQDDPADNDENHRPRVIFSDVVVTGQPLVVSDVSVVFRDRSGTEVSPDTDGAIPAWVAPSGADASQLTALPRVVGGDGALGATITVTDVCEITVSLAYTRKAPREQSGNCLLYTSPSPRD